MVWARNKRVVLPCHEAKEGAMAASLALRVLGSAPCVFQMIEEIEHKRSLISSTPRCSTFLLSSVGRIAHRMLHSVTVSPDRIDCKAFWVGR